ncbi:hypothetical protein HMPREF0578_1663 [Mobiluncus mulieris 28-1]|nr:hypothetical protein HMPREF0578_1663 [Mobiluncus mulieris 28-1]
MGTSWASGGLLNPLSAQEVAAKTRELEATTAAIEIPILGTAWFGRLLACFTVASRG